MPEMAEMKLTSTKQHESPDSDEERNSDHFGSIQFSKEK